MKTGKRYTEKARGICFLALKQIDEQLNALTLYPQLQTMVAVYIYAGAPLGRGRGRGDKPGRLRLF